MDDFFLHSPQSNVVSIGNGLVLEYNPKKEIAQLYRKQQLIKQADLNDTTEKRIVVVDAIEQGCNKSKLAATIDISRQTIHNYMETKKYFSLGGFLSSRL